MARVARAAKGVRRSAAARSRGQAARAARSRSGGLFDRFMAALPFTEEQWHRFFLWSILGAALAVLWAIASFAGVPELAREQIAGSASRAGFEVRKVSVSGTNRMDEQIVYERVLAEQDRPMPLVDLAEVRARLLELPWVKDARVSRQLPDTLKVDIVERVPHAVLKKPDRLVLVDAEGHELEPVSAAKAKGRLMIEGPGAARMVGDLDRLLAAAPALKPRIAAAEWVGNRRWNLTFETGQLLALPEGEAGPAALVRFAKMDGMHRLIGGRPVAIDMRVPDRAYLRCADGPCTGPVAVATEGS